MTEHVRWAFARAYSKSTPYLTPLESRSGLVGEAFFRNWTEETGSTSQPSPPGAGILPSITDLAGDDFSPPALDPLVARVYQNSKALQYRAGRVMWGSPRARALHWLYQKIVARSMKQLSAPVDDGLLPTVISSRIDLITPPPESPMQSFRAWTRKYDRNDEVFYTAATFSFEASGPRGVQRYLCCVLPLVHMNLAVVFHPENLPGGGCKVSTYREGSYCAGVYCVVPGKERFSVFPAPMREHIELRPRMGHSGPYVEGRHETWAFGTRSYTLSYELRASAGAAAE